MRIVPTQPVPNQTFQVTLGNQGAEINIAQRSTGVFLTLSLLGSLVVAGVKCEDKNRIVRDAYLGFAGDLIFFDTQGAEDPVYTGFNSRFLLVYLESADLEALEA